MTDAEHEIAEQQRAMEARLRWRAHVDRRFADMDQRINDLGAEVRELRPLHAQAQAQMRAQGGQR